MIKRIFVSKKVKQILAVGTLGFLLVGCSKSQDTSIEEISKEEEVSIYFQSAQEEVFQLIDRESFSKAKEVSKELFVKGVDFIFYDQPIGHVYFDDLTEQGKEIVMDSMSVVDSAISRVAPDYKENLSEKYQVVEEFVDKTYLDVMDQIREYLGDQNYEAIGEIKDQVGGDLLDLGKEGLSKVKSWYDDFRTGQKHEKG